MHPQFEAHNQLAAFERVKLWADCCFGLKLGPLDTRHLKGLAATRDRDCQQVDIFVPFWQIPPRVRNGIYCFWRISRGGEKMDWQPSAPRRRATLQLPCLVRTGLTSEPLLASCQCSLGAGNGKQLLAERTSDTKIGIEVDGEEPGSD